MGDVIAAVRVGQEGLHALGDPFHRAADALGRPQRHDFLGIDEDLGAEAAADVRRDDAQLVLRRHADERRDDEARHMRILRGVPQGEMAGAGIIFTDRGARLDRIRHQPVVDDVELGDMRGRLERRVGLALVAQLPLIDGVLGRDLVDLRSARRLRLRRIGHRRQHFVIDLDLLGGVLGLRQGLGNHHGDGIADVAGLRLRQRRMRRHLHRAAVLGMDHPAADQIAQLVDREIGAGEHRHHARHFTRCRGVDALDARMGMGRADETGMGLAGSVDVGGVVPLAGDESLVLFAAHRRADAGRAHAFLPSRNGPLLGGLLRHGCA